MYINDIDKMEPETQEDRNVKKYSQETIDKWIYWLKNIPKGAPPADSAMWYKRIGDFSRDQNVLFKDVRTEKLYISPDHFDVFLKKYYPDSNSYFPLAFIDIKRVMDKEVGKRLGSGEPLSLPSSSSIRESDYFLQVGEDVREGQGGSKRKRKSKRKSKSKSKSNRKSKRKSNKKSRRMH